MSDHRRVSRRHALKLLGAGFSLPLLGSLAPLRAAGSPPPRPVRSVFAFVPNGVIGESFFPTGGGRDFDLPPSLAPIAGIREEVLVLTGLTLNCARALGDGPGDHARSSGAFLTCAHPVKTAGKDIRVGVSVDQVLAKGIGGRSRLPSLELGCDPGRATGNCDSGYSCAYVTNLSWAAPDTPAPCETNPRLVFERLFGGQDVRRRRERLHSRRSILDHVAGEAGRLAASLGREDREKLGGYLESVREVERRIEAAEGTEPARPDRPAPGGIPAAFSEHVDLLFELLVLAFRADVTRVASVLVARGGSNRSYPEVEVREGHHHLSHHQGDQTKVEKLQRIDRFHVERFARFVERLRTEREGDGTLLDSCQVVFGSGIGDGNRHTHHDLPILFAGRAGGTVSPGRILRCEKETPLANLYLAMLRRAGLTVDRFGDSTAELPGL